MWLFLHSLLRLILILHGQADMVTLLPVLVLDCDRVVACVVLAEITDRQGTVRPVTPTLKERLEKLAIVVTQ